MQVKTLSPKLTKYLINHNLTEKFNKQLNLFLKNPNHPSLNIEKLSPKTAGLYSFRIDRKYRAIFLIIGTNQAEIVDINDHYQ